MYLNRMKDDITESTTKGVINLEKDAQQASEQIEDATSLPRRKTYTQQLKVIDQIDHQSPVFMMMVVSCSTPARKDILKQPLIHAILKIRSFTYFVIPPVFWVCTTYGIHILSCY